MGGVRMQHSVFFLFFLYTFFGFFQHCLFQKGLPFCLSCMMTYYTHSSPSPHPTTHDILHTLPPPQVLFAFSRLESAMTVIVTELITLANLAAQTERLDVLWRSLHLCTTNSVAPAGAGVPMSLSSSSLSTSSLSTHGHPHTWSSLLTPSSPGAVGKGGGGGVHGGVHGDEDDGGGSIRGGGGGHGMRSTIMRKVAMVDNAMAAATDAAVLELRDVSFGPPNTLYTLCRVCVWCVCV